MDTSNKPEVRVIKGWHGEHHASYHPPGHTAHFFLEQERCPFGDNQSYHPATLVIGDDAIPRSKVVEMLEELRSHPQLLTETSWTFLQVAAKYGITNL